MVGFKHVCVYTYTYFKGFTFGWMWEHCVPLFASSTLPSFLLYLKNIPLDGSAIMGKKKLCHL